MKLQRVHTFSQASSPFFTSSCIHVPLFVCALLLFACVFLTGCSALPFGSNPTFEGTTSGPAYSEPDSIPVNSFNETDAIKFAGGAIDASQTAKGYVAAKGESSTRLKFQVIFNGNSYNYDLPNDNTPLFAPLSLGNGTYTFRIMQNTTGSNYSIVGGTTTQVELENEFVPFLRPSVYCDFTPNSESVKRAESLARDAKNEGDVVRNIYTWIVKNIQYDDAKAEKLAVATGYIPDPDDSLKTSTGICFDYASLAAAMFRSLGLPCKIITGYVTPDDIYHAWNMIYINGEWVSAQVTIKPNEWCRVDTTFGATQGNNKNVGDGLTYTDKFVY